MTLIPNLTPGLWNVLILKSATWPGTTISMIRDGVTIIPVSALMTITDPDGTVVVSQAASIDGAGLMTVPAISAATTAAYTWSYGNVAFAATETGSVVTVLLAGNATCTDRSD